MDQREWPFGEDRGSEGSQGSEGSAVTRDEAYATVAHAMECAFFESSARRPDLTREELLVALLLLKDRLLESHLEPSTLAPEMRKVARSLYAV